MTLFHKCGNPNCPVCEQYENFAEPNLEQKQKRGLFLFTVLTVVALFFLLFIFSPCKASGESLPEKASYQIRCQVSPTTFAQGSGTAISKHLFVSCGHILDDISSPQAAKAEIEIGSWQPARLVKYTNWKFSGDIDLSLWLLPENEFPAFSTPGIVDVTKIDTSENTFTFCGYGNGKHWSVQDVKQIRPAYGNYKEELLTTFNYHHGDSGGGVFYRNNLVAVCKAAILVNNQSVGGANCTNDQLISFLYPEGREKVQCYTYGGQRFCTPSPRIQIGPTQNVYPTSIQPIPVQTQPKLQPKLVPIPQKQPQLPQTFAEPVEKDCENFKIQINALNVKIAELTKDLDKNKKLTIYFTLEGDENCLQTDVQAARIREKGLNIVTVVMKRQDVTVNSVPRLFLMPERRTVYGKNECLTYLQSM